MRLTAIKNVTQRSGAPKVSSVGNGCLSPGDSIQISQVVVGDAIDGNSIWYQSEKGYYYWSGGFAEINFSLPGQKLEGYPPIDQVKILKQLQLHADRVFRDNLDGYLGCGFGYKNYDSTGELALIVHVQKKLPLSDPNLNYKVTPVVSFWGFQMVTDVVEATKATHQNLEVSPPFIGGGISTTVASRKYTGTRSLGVKRQRSASVNEFDFFLIASYHVLLDDLIATNNTYAGQPEKHCVFPLNDSIPGDHLVSEGCYNSNYDYAAIKLGANESVINQIEGFDITDFYQVEELLALKTKTVQAVGYKSKLQSGTVLSIFNKIELLPHRQVFEDVIFSENISTEGDSGAPVVESESHKLVGFIIGGNDRDLSYILPFYNLNYEKKFQIS
jgi:hypothetical protein